MIQPLSRKKRRGYILFFSFLFIVITPILILYATGYRLTDTFSLGRTGGLYITAEQSGIQIYVNNKLIKETGIFQKNIFVQNLAPGTFVIETHKDGLISWKKELAVYPETVTEAHTFMLPKDVTLNEILPFIDTDGTPTTSVKFLKNKNPEFVEINSLFLPPKIIKTAATTTPDTKVLGKLYLKKILGRIHAQWMGNPDEKPLYFCQDNVCKKEIVIQTPSPVGAFDFFPGRSDLVIVVLDSGIYVSEIDDRSGQNIQPMLNGENLDMRVKDNIIYVKKENAFFSASF
ncbi:MAG: hypothetical protein ACYC1K_00695 [Minisyncoccota bacterium]